MLATVTAYIERHHLLPENGEVIVAVSGGADSLCLLHLLHCLCGRGKRYPDVQLRVAHLNHGLRGEAGMQDAAAVAELAGAWGLPVTIGQVDVPALARKERRSLEEAARVARYRFLRQLAQGRPIAVAHHADDQVETLLLHLLRGGGLHSMAGMLPRQQDIIRPLLAVSHAQTLAYCREHHLVPLEDASNTDPRFLRNRIRHELLPLLESLNPGIRSTLLRNAEVIRADVAWIETQVDACWSTVVTAEQNDLIKANAQQLLALPLSIQRHLLRRVTAHLCGGQSPLELRHYLLLEQFLHTGRNGPLDLPQGLHVIYEAGLLTFHRLPAGQQRLTKHSEEPRAVPLPISGRIEVPGTSWVASVELLPDELLLAVRDALHREDWPRVWQLLPPTPHTAYVDADIVGSALWVRTRRPGDRIRPLGMLHEKKVQDVLVDKHIARSDRSHIPLFFSATHCIWLAGVCLDDRIRLTNKTRRILRLRIDSYGRN